MSPRFIIGYYQEESSDFDQQGMRFLKWTEGCASYDDIKSNDAPADVWVLVYDTSRISPLYKHWIPYKELNQSHAPAKYPAPLYPSKYNGNMVLSMLTRDGTKYAYRVNYPPEPRYR